VREKSRKLLEGRKSNLEHFLLLTVLQISTEFELFKRFQVKAGLTDLCSYRLISTLFPNQPELQFGQGVRLGDLQCMF
jgi:hypothetical protein